MRKFIYHEKIGSRLPALYGYIRCLFSLLKAEIISNDNAKRMRIHKRITSLIRMSKVKEYPSWFQDHPEGRLAVYTVLYGDYDRIKPVRYRSPQCDYYIITDQPIDKKSGWVKLEEKLPDFLKGAPSSVQNRYFKMNPDLLFPEYEYSLYIDATMQPVYDVFPLLGRMGEHFLGMYRHEARDCVYEEAKTVIRIGKASENEVNQLVWQYRSEGFPEHFGLTAGGIILRRHNSKECRDLMRDWWNMFINGPKRDQLSLMFCLWKKGYTLGDVAELGADYQLEARFSSEAHK